MGNGSINFSPAFSCDPTKTANCIPQKTHAPSTCVNLCVCVPKLIAIRAVDCGLHLVQTIIFLPVNSRSVLQTHLLPSKYASVKCVWMKAPFQRSQYTCDILLLLFLPHVFFFGLIFGICNYLCPVYFSGVPVMKKKQCLLILLLCLITLANEWGPVLERYFIGSTCACVCACVCSVFSSVPHLKPLILG